MKELLSDFGGAVKDLFAGIIPKRRRKTVAWKWDCGVYMCFCPYCNEPAYEKDKCVFCGRKFDWVEGEHQPTVVEKDGYTIIQATNCHITVIEGDLPIIHSSCTRKMTEEELYERLDFYISNRKENESLYKRHVLGDFEEDTDEEQ